MDKKIKELEGTIERMRYANADKDYVNYNPEKRLLLEIDLMKQGCHVEQHHHGLLVNKKFVVAISKNKWRTIDRHVWYWYKDIPTFVSKYVRQDTSDQFTN
jgi:hypothetical protein